MRRVVWIDLENSPHVQFFRPWARWLREDGHEVLFTARDLSQTLELLRGAGETFTEIGGHARGGRLGKMRAIVRRARSLRGWARRRSIDLAMGHGSRAQVLAAAALSVPSVTFFDYEFVSMRLFGLLCRRVFVPDAVPPERLRNGGIPERKRVAFPGFKEQVYLDANERPRAPADPPLILVRPPARQAHYHRALSDRLYARLCDRLSNEAGGCRVIFLPRYPEDREDLAALAARHRHIEVQTTTRDAAELLSTASLVVSGGGTMVREAAVLGVPAASYFGGPVGGVDAALARAGRLRLLRTPAEVDSLPLPGPGPASIVGPGPTGLPASAQEVRSFLRQAIRALLDELPVRKRHIRGREQTDPEGQTR